MSHITCCDFDECLAALSDETRERILVLLGDREMSVNELTQHFAVTQPTISHHLAVLRRAHLVSTRRDGRQMKKALVIPLSDKESAWKFLDEHARAPLHKAMEGG